MANQTSGQGSTSAHGGGAQVGGARRGDQGLATTGVRDTTYNLISITYHALQGAETYQMYEQDAQGDQELAQFFRQACEEQMRLAQQAKQLLMRHLQRQGGTGGQQLQSGASGQQASGSTGTSRSSQQSQSVPGDQYGSSQNGAVSGHAGGGTTRQGSRSKSEGSR